MAVLLFPVLVMSIGMRWDETMLSFAQIAPLLWRRHRPALVFGLVTAASAFQVLVLLVPVWGQVAFPIALYSVARFGTMRQGQAALGVGLVGGVVGPVRWLDGSGSLDAVTLLSYFLTIAAIVVAAWALGNLNRVRADYSNLLIERSTAPLPGLDELAALLEDARSEGTELTVRLPEVLPEVPAGVELTVYRVVQEALSNVRKHAGPNARVDLSIAAPDGVIEVRVADDGRGAAAPDDGYGLGLAGMRERIRMHGGELHAGPRKGGGYEVSAKIPRGSSR